MSLCHSCKACSRTAKKSIKQSIKQSINQSISRRFTTTSKWSSNYTPINPDIKQSINQSINQSNFASFKPPVNRAVNGNNNQSISQSINQSINQSHNRLGNNQSNQSLSRSVNNPASQSINQPINQSINQSISQSEGSLAWAKSYQSIKQPISQIDRLILFGGSTLMGFLDTHRGDMIAMLGETAPFTDQSINYMFQSINQSVEGQTLLHEKPRLIDDRLIDRLIDLPPQTLGHQYAAFMKCNGFTPSSRVPVRYINRGNQSVNQSTNQSINQSINQSTSELDAAYIIQRYREVHDIWHVLTCNDADVLGELGQKVFEARQTFLPMTGVTALGGSLRLSINQLKQYVTEYVPWGLRAGKNASPLMGVYWERRWMQNVDDLRREFNIECAPKRWDK